MTAATVRRLTGRALALALVAAAPAALAQDFTVAASAGSPPIANAATQDVASSVSFDVTNTRSGTTIRQIDFTLPKFWTATGGAGPAGWIVAGVSEHANDVTVSFRVAACGTGGLGNGVRGTFRLDFTPATGYASDGTATFNSISPSDPCGGAAGWAAQGPSIIPVKVLQVTATASPSAGASPLAATVTFTVTNKATAARTVLAPAPVVNPGASYTATGCAPTSRSLAAGASGAFTCGYTFNPAAAASYTVAATVTSSPAGSSAVGAVAGPILAGPATATFAFDELLATSGDTVRATLSVTNQTGSAMTITPPGYAALGLTNLVQAAGTLDPAAIAGVPAGATRTFVYVLTVTGAVGASFLASGTAAVTGGTSNLAVTPAGTVSGWRVTWLPAARRSGAAGPYQFTVTVTNLAASALGEIDIVNPQNGTWKGLANVSATGMSYSTKTTAGQTDTLKYTGSLAQNAAATLVFRFTSVPTVTSTTAYPFQAVMFGAASGGGTTDFPVGTYDASVFIAIPLGDVANLSILSTSTGQTLYWTNTSNANGTHDGVVVFRAAAPAVPQLPVDGTDYSGSVSPGGPVVYFDKLASPIASIADASPGAFNYRVCNHDANFIYSSCSTGFWNNAGWLDSATAPAGGWTHTSGYQALLYPGIEPGGRVAIASNAPALNVLVAATGARPFDPVSLAAVPAMGTPIATLGNGRQILFAADQGGVVTAVDMTTGASYWQVTKAGESFVSGVGGALRQYTVPAFQSKYANDVLFLGSTTGRLLALDATTGATLWIADAGNAIRTLPLYDYARNWLYVPTNGGGIVAYDLGSAPTPPTPPASAAGWVNPGGAYTVGCTRADVAAQMTCVDKSGNIQVLDRSNGSVVATGGFAGGGTPDSLWKVAGGLVVGSSSRVEVFTLSGATFTSRGTYRPPGSTLSPLQVFASAGFIYIGGSDLKLHKLALADATELGAVTVTSQQAGTLLGPAVFDVSSNLFIFGASDGHVWAVPYF